MGWQIQAKLSLSVFLLACLAVLSLSAEAQNPGRDLEITPNFNGKEITADRKIELQLNRTLNADDGSLAFLLNQTDLTALFVPESQIYSYAPKFFALPVGENKLTVYLVNQMGDWSLLKEFTFRVGEKAKINPSGNADKKSEAKSEKSKTEVEFTPSLTVNVKGESNVLFFPATSRPERLSFTDTAGQGGLQIKVRRNGWTIGGKFDFAGSGRETEALRFGELGKNAPQIDLSSYQVQIEKGRFKANFGSVSFGTQRHLINGFSSRGLNLTVPIGKQNEITFSAMNGTSIVGFDNFAGLSQADHQVYGATFAREFIKERPGGLRLEVTAMRGSLLPLNSFNKRTVNDAEESYGGAVRLQFKDKKERLRFEGGFTKSRFTNRADPSLEQGLQLTQITPVTRDARFIEASFDVIQGLKLFDDRKLKVTGTYRHEEIEPLFRSTAASTQADRRQNQFEITAGFGDINFTYGNLRDRDNLGEISSILKTLNRRNNVIFAMSPGTFFNPAKPIKWLPRIAYSYDHVHQFGAFFPVNGDFRDPSQVPDQDSFNQSFNAEFQLSEKIRVGYRYNRAFQDNKQPGRESADFLSSVNAVTIGISTFKNVNLNFDLSQEQQKSFESLRIDRQFRFGSNLTWQNAFLKNLTFSSNLSMNLAGDRANTNDKRNVEFDMQWAYKFSFGKEKFKKIEAQFFVRYANRYGESRDHVLFLYAFNKFQGFNAGLTFNLF